MSMLYVLLIVNVIFLFANCGLYILYFKAIDEFNIEVQKYTSEQKQRQDELLNFLKEESLYYR